MNNCKAYLTSTIGKKQIVAITGLIWAGFTLTHMAGNMLILVGPDIYNKYGHTLISNPALPLAELVLVLSFVVHIGLAIHLTLLNRSARPVSPNLGASNCVKRASFASRTMILSGLVVLIFVILHLITFKYGTEYKTVINGVEMRDLHRLITEKFQDSVFVIWYLVALAVLGLHLSHGISALVQSLGLGSARNSCLKKIGWAFAVTVALGFMSQPIFILVKGGR